VVKSLKNEIIIDGVREIVNIAAANASTNISELLDKVITISVPDLKHISIYDLYSSLSDYLEREIYAGIVKFKENMSGYLVLFFDKDTFEYLSKTALTKYLGEDAYNEAMACDTLKELVNIFASSYTTALYNFIGIYSTHTPPEIAHDFLGAILNTILSEMSQHLSDDNILLIKIDFIFYVNNEKTSKRIDAWMIHFMTDSDLELLSSAIKSSIQ